MLDTQYTTQFAATHSGLQAQFPGRAMVSPGEALLTIPGLRPADPENAALQRRQAGTYPFPTKKIGGRVVVLLADIAGAMLAAPTTGTAPEEIETPAAVAPPSRRRGRPRKSLQIVDGGAA